MTRTVSPEGVVFFDRAEAGLGDPVNNNGSKRPKLAPNRPQMTAHYPGWLPHQGTGELLIDPGAQGAYMRKMQLYAIGGGKSFEYNYVIFMNGAVWEYAGLYLAAHSAGENSISIGVQFVNNVVERGTAAQIFSFQWLRDRYLKPLGSIRTDLFAPTPHRWMPEAATSCPGDNSIMPILNDLSQPFEYTPPPIPVPEDEMFTLFRITDAASQPVLKVVGRTFATWVYPAEFDRLKVFHPTEVANMENHVRAHMIDVALSGPIPDGMARTDFKFVCNADAA